MKEILGIIILPLVLLIIFVISLYFLLESVSVSVTRGYTAKQNFCESQGYESFLESFKNEDYCVDGTKPARKFAIAANRNFYFLD